LAAAVEKTTATARVAVACESLYRAWREFPLQVGPGANRAALPFALAQGRSMDMDCIEPIAYTQEPSVSRRQRGVAPATLGASTERSWCVYKNQVLT
jgi:hypothetical protein